MNKVSLILSAFLLGTILFGCKQSSDAKLKLALVEIFESEEMYNHFMTKMKVDSLFIQVHSAHSTEPLSFNHRLMEKEFFIVIDDFGEPFKPYPFTLDEAKVDSCLTPNEMTGLLLDNEDSMEFFIYYHCSHLVIHYTFIDDGENYYLLNVEFGAAWIRKDISTLALETAKIPKSTKDIVKHEVASLSFPNFYIQRSTFNIEQLTSRTQHPASNSSSNPSEHPLKADVHLPFPHAYGLARREGVGHTSAEQSLFATELFNTSLPLTIS